MKWDKKAKTRKERVSTSEYREMKVEGVDVAQRAETA